MNHHKVTHPGIPLPKHCIATLDGSAITTSASPKKRKHFQLQWRPLNQIVPGQQIPFVTSRIKQQMNHQPLVDNATIRFEIEKGKTASSTESDTFLGSLTCRTSTQSILSPTISSTSSSIISSSSTDTSLSFSSLSSLYSACPRLPLQSTYQQSPLLTMDMNSSAEKGCVSIRDINDTENNTMFAWRPSVPSFHSIYRSGTDITELTSSLKTVNTTTADTNPAVSVKFLPSIKTFLSTTI
ncbi:hypothetical protein BDF20DRAFT_449293 [Mycotypha africana]|uniref:uncharacterized protein n=1 Tax=Mycotypha africana TaxID=64632 RepID=UPI002300B70C|nr:uncharacterized protein BDF20DRAFT_449293 [Mycotypha africana]KAI8982064.1 hypothetical protein BDF20DRAFT_449293 [Mycotypha africana]